MRVAIMQPYLFPYIGYFQLIRAVDTFVLLDDVQYINKGWINRNYWIVNKQKHRFIFSLKKDSTRSLICHRYFSMNIEKETADFLETFRRNYRFCQHVGCIQSLIQESLESPHLVTAIFKSIQIINHLLEIKTPVHLSSVLDSGTDLHGQARIIHLVKMLGGTHYINLPGGLSLYDEALFTLEQLDLNFIQPHLLPYPQHTQTFIPGLSILDVLANTSAEQRQTLLNAFSLLKKEQLVNA